MANLEKIKNLATDVCVRESCRLYDIELVGSGKNRVLRVMIERKDNDRPVDLSDCTNVSNGLSLLLDVDDAIVGGEYQLEVSTPGVERPLKELWHFSTAIEKTVRFKLRAPLEQLAPEAKKHRATIAMQAMVKGLHGDMVQIELDGQVLDLPISGIERAQVVFELNKGTKNKKTNQKTNKKR